jgi:diguanylate cyclase (GGDEF)-like protein
LTFPWRAAPLRRRTIISLAVGALIIALAGAATIAGFDQMTLSGKRTRILINTNFAERDAYRALLFQEVGVMCALTTARPSCLENEGLDAAAFAENRKLLGKVADREVAAALRRFNAGADALEPMLQGQVALIRGGRSAEARRLVVRGQGTFVDLRAAEAATTLAFANALERYRVATRAANSTVETLTAILALVLLAAGASATILIARANRESFLARSDVLTGLPNRRAFEELLTKALRKRRPHESVGVLYLDLDDFKQVNDRHGHAAGDALLARLARRIHATVRDEDVAARLGGDEFGVLLAAIEDERDAIALAERLVIALAAPFVIEEEEMHVGASIGVAVAPRDATDAEALVAAADAAMYRAKPHRHPATS